jgi:hypothetical protein
MSWDSDTGRTRIGLCARKSTHHQLSATKEFPLATNCRLDDSLTCRRLHFLSAEP